MNDIKAKMKRNGVRQWQVAEYLGIDESVFSRKLRHELSTDEYDAVIRAIAEIANDREVKPIE